MAVTDDPRDLLGPYALHAVDDEEARAVEELVARDAEAAHELATFADLAARLADAAATEPPAHLRASVLAAIRAQGATVLPPVTAPVAPQVPGTAAADDEPAAPVSLDSRRRRPSAVRWVAVAAALVVGAAIPGSLAVQQAQRADRAVQAQESASAQLARVLADPSAVVVRQDVTGGGAATAVFTDTESLFTAAGLPSADADSVYQLWYVGDAIESAGLLDETAGTVVALAAATDGALAITLEPAGGSEQPTMDPLVVLARA